MKYAVIVGMFAIAVASCGNLGKQFDEMKAVRSVIDQRFGIKDASVTLTNNKYLTVTLVNTPYNDSSDKVKQQLADSIGQVCKGYFHADSLLRGTVNFVEQHNYVIASSSSSHGFPMHLHGYPKVDSAQ